MRSIKIGLLVIVAVLAEQRQTTDVLVVDQRAVVDRDADFVLVDADRRDVVVVVGAHTRSSKDNPTPSS